MNYLKLAETHTFHLTAFSVKFKWLLNAGDTAGSDLLMHENLPPTLFSEWLKNLQEKLSFKTKLLSRVRSHKFMSFSKSGLHILSRETPQYKMQLKSLTLATAQ